MKTVLIVFVSVFFMSGYGFGDHNDLKVSDQSKELLEKSESSQFTIEKNLVERLFSESVPDHPSFGENSKQVDLGFGQFVPQEMKLTNKYFSISYKDNLSAFSLISASLAKPIFSGKSSIFLKTGYAFAQGVYNVHGESGSDHSDSVSVQWVPLQVGMGVDLFSVAFIRLKSQAGIGEDFFSQSGTLDGITQNFIIPHAFVGATTSFFEKRNQSGFEGISLTSNYQRSLGQDQTIKGWSFILASRFVL